MSTPETGARSIQTLSVAGAQSRAGLPAVASRMPLTATHPAGAAATTLAGELDASWRTSGSTVPEAD
jgi:hypothetical protein